MKINLEEDYILNIDQSDLNLADTLDCGQCFRFTKTDENTIEGIAYNKVLKITQFENQIIFHNTTKKEFDEIWENYFDLKTDYNSIKSNLMEDCTLKKALEYAGGIRILRQDSFETLISFIISQNNNIKRIKSSIDKLCLKYGEQIDENNYDFPDIEKLASLDKSDIADLSLGYRDEYLIDCSRKIADGIIDLNEISRMEIEKARETLRLIKGVGPKVAECVLLFGFYRKEAFPIDTWIKKALNYFYQDGFPKEFLEIAGIAQQYLFHYIRTCKDSIPEELRKKN